MLHHQDKEINVEFTAVNFNVNAIKAEDAANLEHLQKQRKKASYARKPYWQKRIDEHFGLK
jgi:hypothetical protein